MHRKDILILFLDFSFSLVSYNNNLNYVELPINYIRTYEGSSSARSDH